MKIKLNTTFFGILFLTALLAEAYCIIALEGDIISVIGLGVVVLITGYLLADSIKTKIHQKSEKTKFFLEQLYREETEKWNERYSEMVNIWKATYSATKKNNELVRDQIEELLNKVDRLEKNNEKALLRISELQKKALEGQKNALNLEINYGRENMKQLIKFLQEDQERNNYSKQLDSILMVLENNQIILQDKLNQIPQVNASDGKEEYGIDYEEEYGIDYEVKDSFANLEEANTELEADDRFEYNASDSYEYEEKDYLNNTETENAFDRKKENFQEEDSVEISYEDTYKETPELEGSLTGAPNSEEELITENNNIPDIVPLYDDPNKALTADEIASLFASFGQ